MGMMLSPNISLDDVIASNTAKARKIDNHPCPKALERLKLLATNLIEKIRDKAVEEIKRPFGINSSYRCPALNDAVGGSKTSQHMLGEAMDISYHNTDDNKKLFNIIRTMVKNKEITVGQLINEKNYSWIHVSLPSATHVNEQLDYTGGKYINKKNILDT